MSFLHQALDFFLHIDVHLAQVIQDYGTWTYGILFLVIFCETGLVVLPFLPGDSLLFAAGSFAALGSLNPWFLFGGLAAAAIIGDNVNYWVGRYIGPRAFSGELRFLKQKHLDETRAFFARHGRSTIILARFVPIIRTFTPFVAGVGQMPYPVFLAYDIGGGVLWVGVCTWSGYLFGNIPFVRQHFTLVILAIIGISMIPLLIQVLRSRRTAAE